MAVSINQTIRNLQNKLYVFEVVLIKNELTEYTRNSSTDNN